MIRIKVPFLLEDYLSLDRVDQIPQNIKNWLKKVEEANKELNKNKTVEDHHQYIDDNKHLWADEDLKEWMLKLSKDKCWYTEVKHGADYPEIEHFRPKKNTKKEDSSKANDGYYWLAFNLTNYRLCKPMPNRKKGTFFPIVDESKRAKCCDECHLDEIPIFLDPLSSNDTLLLSFNDIGEPEPAIGCTTLQKKRVNLTVKRFGLDHNLLNRRRKEVWKQARLLFNRYLRLTADAEKTSNVKMISKAEEALDKVLDLMKPSAEFSSVAKESLKKTNDPMAINIITSF